MRQKQHARQLEGADRAASGFRVTAKSEARNIRLREVKRDAARRLWRQIEESRKTGARKP